MSSPDEPVSKGSKKPGEMDQYIGRRLRLWRRTMGVDAYALAERIGITYQQLQKYEKGMNRISATRLYRIACELNVPIDYFYGEISTQPQSAQPLEPGMNASAELALLINGSGANLLKCYAAIKNMQIRRAVLNLLRTVAKEDAVAPEQPADTLSDG